MKRIFLIHGWGGSPNNDWFPWAKKILIEKGYEVVVPEMPDTEHPKISPWVGKLKRAVGELRPDDIFVGHSIGCQTILRFLESLPEGKRVDKVILIAPWWYLTLDEGESQVDADPWLVQDVNFLSLHNKSDKYICVFSDNDPYVPLEPNVKFFKEELKPEVIIKKNMEHFNTEKIEFLLDIIK